VGTTLALVLLAVGTAGLFYFDRDRRSGNSPALWLPVVWLLIVGSRPLSAWLGIWFGIGMSGPQGLDAQLDGSPTDAALASIILVAGIAVLFRRKRETASLLRGFAPLYIYFAYALLSCLWSPFTDVAFKRWTKAIGDLVMVMVIVTDPKPVAALHRLFSRVGFILLPASIFMIRYTIWGRGFDPDGSPTNTGVTTNKNMLGLITFVIALGALWSCLDLLLSNRGRTRNRRLAAQVTLLAFGIAVLQQAHSSTSIACFMLGGFLILATCLPFFKQSPKRVQALFMTILLLGGICFIAGGEATVAGAFGKDPSLSDRTKIWAAVIPLCPNPIIGAGFESFWNGYGKYVTNGLSKFEQGLNSAHDGYIEVYLNLGWIGVTLVAMLLVTGYFRACAAYRLSPKVGGLMLAFVGATAIYSITESGFRIMTPTWISLLLVCAGSQALALSASRESATLRDSSLGRNIRTGFAKVSPQPFKEREPAPSAATPNSSFRRSRMRSGNGLV
jgi:exopolysaccharide production protein ExoQ